MTFEQVLLSILIIMVMVLQRDLSRKEKSADLLHRRVDFLWDTAFPQDKQDEDPTEIDDPDDDTPALAS